MTIYIAHKTLAAVDAALEKDGGNLYREWLQRILPYFDDIYRQEDSSFRSHLGASLMGEACARKLWYSYRWVSIPKFPGRILRLFNRGHMEEARIIACLLAAGVQVYQQDENGKQFRIHHAGGHVGGSGDGYAIGIPDLPAGMQCLLEFKTHSDKSWIKVSTAGVRAAKFVHFVQMQLYMRKMGMTAALYIAVNKNTDAWHAELIGLDTALADQYLERGLRIVTLPAPPDRIAKSPGHFECTFCDFKVICHNLPKKQVERNCRSCIHSQPVIEGDGDGVWYCTKHEKELPKELQLIGCDKHELNSKI